MAEFNAVESKTIYDSEQRLISGIINNPSSLDDVLLRLEPQDFLNPEMAIIFEVISQLHRQAKNINQNTITEYIEGNRNLRFDDFQLVIQTIILKDVTPAEIDDYIDIVKNASIKRKMADFANTILTKEVDFTQFDTHMYDLLKNFSNIVSSKRLAQIQSIKDLAPNFTKR